MNGIQEKVDKLWNIICCYITIDEQNEIQIRKKAKSAEMEEFDEWNKQYVTCCGMHIKTLTKAIISIKIFVFITIILSSLQIDVSPLITFGVFLFFGLAITSYAIFWMGLQTNRFHFLIPYFFVSFVLIVIGVVYLFVDILDSANTRDTTEIHRISAFLLQIAMIVFEVYSLMLVWRVFQYICDARMAKEIEEMLLIKSGMYDDEYLHIV